MPGLPTSSSSRISRLTSRACHSKTSFFSSSISFCESLISFSGPAHFWQILLKRLLLRNGRFGILLSLIPAFLCLFTTGKARLICYKSFKDSSGESSTFYAGQDLFLLTISSSFFSFSSFAFFSFSASFCFSILWAYSSLNTPISGMLSIVSVFMNDDDLHKSFLFFYSFSCFSCASIKC